MIFYILNLKLAIPGYFKTAYS